MSHTELMESPTGKVLTDEHQLVRPVVLSKKFVSDVSISSLQVMLNQLCALLIFYIASKYFDKNIFGEINWCLAVLMISFAVLGCGIDQIAVQKIAAGNNAAALQKIYLFHVLITGFSFFILLLAADIITKNTSQRFNLLLFLSIGQLFAFISSPFKQIANGREQFKSLFVMSTCANVIKVLALSAIAIMDKINLSAFISIYIISSAIELIICIYIGKANSSFRGIFEIKKKEYASLIKESVPQLGIIIFNSAIARFDWVLLGIISTSAILAEYSFAYKAFELSTFPLLIIAPVLLPKITRWFSHASNESRQQKLKNLFLLARSEIVLACFLSLILNILWVPVIDAVTNNKYGGVNVINTLILSCSVPFLYANNILWSVNFAQRRMKLIFSIITATFIIACAGDIILIPFFHGEGAALAYLIAIIFQTFLFIKRTALEGTSTIWRCLLSCCGNAFISGFSAKYFTDILWLQLLLSIGFYTLLAFLSKQIKFNELLTPKRIALK